jgi:DNA repair exonuclease SbcCD ATPase subunit
MRLSLVNFRHHQKLELDLPSEGVILLSGASGTGKSTVLAAFEYLLYGKLRKVSTFDQTKTVVTLQYDGIAVKTFKDDEGVHPEFITIMRRRDPSTLQLTCGDRVYKDDEAQGIIVRLFGAEDVFMASSYLKQGERSILLDGSNSDKMQLVEQFAFNDDNIAEYKATLAEELKKSGRTLDSATGVIKHLEGQVESYKVLNERSLTLYADEVKRRTAPTTQTLTQESLEGELATLSTTHDSLWAQKNNLEVQERSRISVLSANAEKERQIAELRATLKTEYSSSVITETENQIQKLQEQLLESQLLEEYSTLKRNDQARADVFREKYGLERPVLPEMDGTLDRDAIFSEKEHLERQVRENVEIVQANAEVDDLPIPKYTVDELLEEKQSACWLEEYKTLKDRDTKRSTAFKEAFGTTPPEPLSPIEDEGQLHTELAQLQQVQSRNSELISQLGPEPVHTVSELESELEVSQLLQEYEKVKDYTPIPIPDTPYPHDLTVLSKLRGEEVQALATLNLVNESVGTTVPEEIQARLEEERRKLATCGCKVECPQCKAELVYMDGDLKPVTAVRKSRPLPPKISSRYVAPPSPVAQSPVQSLNYCTDPPELIHRSIGNLEHALKMLTGLKSLSEHETALHDLEELMSALQKQQAQSRELALKTDLEVKLDGRSTTRTVPALKVELKAVHHYTKVQAQIQEVSEERIAELRKTIASISHKRDQQDKLSAFEQHVVIEQEALGRRLEILCKLYPELEQPQLLLFDNQPLTVQWRALSVITSDLQQARQYAQIQVKRRTPHVVDTGRLEELRTLLVSIDAQREVYLKNKDLLSLFVQQDELLLQALNHRLVVLQKLHPDQDRDTLQVIDSEPLTTKWRPALELKAELSALKSQLTFMQKARDILHQIEAYRASIQPVPDSVAKEIAKIVSELATLTKRRETLQQLRGCLSIKLHLNTMDEQLSTQRVTVKDESKKYAILDKLRIKALETESLTLESTIASINLEMSQQLENLFDTPITVRFETIKTMKTSGLSKHCINLAVNYRGVMYDDISQLSGGEAARISLAVTLALNKASASPLLMLDESLSALDEDLVDTVIDALKEVSARYSVPIFVVLHGCCVGQYDHVVSF